MAWTTTRRRFTNSDLEVGVEYGIEWGTPKGSCHILKVENKKITVEFNRHGGCVWDPVGTFEFKSLQEFNKFLITFD